MLGGVRRDIGNREPWYGGKTLYLLHFILSLEDRLNKVRSAGLDLASMDIWEFICFPALFFYIISRYLYNIIAKTP